MAVDDTAPRRGPIALADLFDAALKDLAPKPSAPAPMPAPTPAASGDAFLFSGNRHESVPRRLFLDRRLTPLERNAWQVFRLMLNDDGVTAFPTYEQLRPGWRPCPARAGLARDRGAGADAAAPDALAEPGAATARPQDRPHPRQPLRPARRTPDTVRGHAARRRLPAWSASRSAIRPRPSRSWACTLKEIAEDPMLSGRTLPSRLQVLAERLASQGITATEVIHRRTPSTIPKKGPSLLRNANARLRNPKQGRNPRQTALFGIRSRTVQYVVVVLMKYVLPRRRARWATCNGPSASRN
jgi:hypothetical protein